MSVPALTLRLRDSVVIAFQLIPAGSFLMGSRGQRSDEEPRHTVRITRPFYLGTYLVTRSQFGVWTREAGVAHRNYFGGSPDHPAENLDWHQAMAFCAWLTTACASELPPGYMATLPTEAEWEYACRAGTDTEFASGDAEEALRQVGWYWENAGRHTQPVGAKRSPNALGLHDMHGNVWEWCWDMYDAEAYGKRVDGATDPGSRERCLGVQEQRLRESGDVGDDDHLRVVRGGSWVGRAELCRSACRDHWVPSSRLSNRGFRVCLVPGPVTGEQ